MSGNSQCWADPQVAKNMENQRIYNTFLKRDEYVLSVYHWRLFSIYIRGGFLSNLQKDLNILAWSTHVAEWEWVAQPAADGKYCFWILLVKIPLQGKKQLAYFF